MRDQHPCAEIKEGLGMRIIRQSHDAAPSYYLLNPPANTSTKW